MFDKKTRVDNLLEYKFKRNKMDNRGTLIVTIFRRLNDLYANDFI